MRISTRAHALLDFATAGLLWGMPRLAGASASLRRATTALALGKIGYSLLTRYEGGLVRVLPMKAHLALDAATGAALATLPLWSQAEDEPAVRACCVAAGVLEVTSAALSDPRSGPAVRVPGLNAHVTTELPGEEASAEPATSDLTLPEVSLVESLKVHLNLTLPMFALGPIIRRPTVEWLAEKLGFPINAVATLRDLRRRYGSGPLMVGTPMRRQAVVLDSAHMRRILDESPEPFATAEVTKQSALAHFEPRMSLISHGGERAERRQLNEEVLEHTHAVHHLADAMLKIVDEEAQTLLGRVEQVGELGWSDFQEAWFCVVRRIVFGNSAREDRGLTDLMGDLRANGNWLFLRSIDKQKRHELRERIRHYLRYAEPGSLAAIMSAHASAPTGAPEDQIPQWLFAFGPTGMATFRTLALLATHPEELQRAREETAGGRAADRAQRPFLRACMLESLRLWPTSPAILRQSTRATRWENGVMPAGTSILIYTPLFHRDPELVPFANAFSPDVWIADDPEVQGNPPRDWPFAPFSGGSGVCPGRNVVLTLSSAMLTALIGDRSLTLTDPERIPHGDLPAMLDHFTLTFRVG